MSRRPAIISACRSMSMLDMTIGSAKHEVSNAVFLEPAALPGLIHGMAARFVATLAVGAVVLVAADLVWSRLFWQRELRMTRQELKEEMKQVDGDPIVKARLRSLARDRLRKRMTPLSGADNQIYAVAQGPLAVSGFSSVGKAETLTQGVPTTGRIPNGALIEREGPGRFADEKVLVLELRNPDFKTAVRVADAINTFTQQRYGVQVARENDLRTISINRPFYVGAARFMNEESTKLQALQVKQQLGIQALSIANSGSQSILSLFR